MEKRGFDATTSQFYKTLFEEIEELAPLFTQIPLQSVYFGGGTLGDCRYLFFNNYWRLFTRLLIFLKLKSFVLNQISPASQKEKLQVLQKYGITRLSVGLQNLDPTVLKQNNRIHSFNIEKKLSLLQEYRFHHLNLDVILGIPGLRLVQFERNIRNGKITQSQSYFNI